ncbi:MAG TPA: S28 family serine protease [Bacteroidota bacterium]
MTRSTLLLLFVSVSLALAQNDDLYRKLKSLPDVVEVTAVKADSMYKACYELRVRQPLDHARPEGKSFLQTVVVAHVDYAKPVVLETEGYALRGGGRPRELGRLLKCNQIAVEHRFFARSTPDSLEWKYLTTRQSADDLHHVRELLKTVYTGKWVSSGVSKGGQTTLFYRYYYPDDVDASVPYVAPVNLAQEDPRIITFLQTVGTPEVREKLRAFQLALLRREKEILPLMDTLAARRKFTFSLGKAVAYEYSVLEYPCGFWQGGHRPEEIPPPEAPADSMLRNLDRIASFFYYADQGIKTYEPFQYQAYTEIGYYGYDITPFRDLLTAVKDPTNSILAPRNVELHFNPAVMYNVYTWLRDHGNKILYLYGETDLWGATAMVLSGKTDAVKIVKKGGSHSTRIGNLPPEQQDLAHAALVRWLGPDLVPPFPTSR